MADEKIQKDTFPQHAEAGWWEYGVAGYKWTTGKPVEPRWSASQLTAEIEAERYEHLYVVKRWITPGVWQRLEPSERDDHPTVSDWEWEKYLEWREKEMAKSRALATRRDITDEGDDHA